MHLWRPAQGAVAAGFEPTGAPVDLLAGYGYDKELYTLDLNADGKVDLLALRRSPHTSARPWATGW